MAVRKQKWLLFIFPPQRSPSPRWCAGGWPMNRSATALTAGIWAKMIRPYHFHDLSRTPAATAPRTGKDGGRKVSVQVWETVAEPGAVAGHLEASDRGGQSRTSRVHLRPPPGAMRKGSVPTGHPPPGPRDPRAPQRRPPRARPPPVSPLHPRAGRPRRAAEDERFPQASAPGARLAWRGALSPLPAAPPRPGRPAPGPPPPPPRGPPDARLRSPTRRRPGDHHETPAAPAPANGRARRGETRTSLFQDGGASVASSRAGGKPAKPSQAAARESTEGAAAAVGGGSGRFRCCYGCCHAARLGRSSLPRGVMMLTEVSGGGGGGRCLPVTRGRGRRRPGGGQHGRGAGGAAGIPQVPPERGRADSTESRRLPLPARSSFAVAACPPPGSGLPPAVASLPTRPAPFAVSLPRCSVASWVSALPPVCSRSPSPSPSLPRSRPPRPSSASMRGQHPAFVPRPDRRGSHPTPPVTAWWRGPALSSSERELGSPRPHPGHLSLTPWEGIRKFCCTPTLLVA